MHLRFLESFEVDSGQRFACSVLKVLIEIVVDRISILNSTSVFSGLVRLISYI